jgi:hypothetical protein
MDAYKELTLPNGVWYNEDCNIGVLFHGDSWGRSRSYTLELLVNSYGGKNHEYN